MRANFLVSAHPQARISAARRLFVTDPYVTYVLKKSGELKKFEEVVSADPVRVTREAFARDHEFVDRKYHQYVPILARRLNELHGTEHDQRFWQKALSLALLRHITFCYDQFQTCEANLRPEQHDCRILSESSFFVPKDFNEHRRFFQHSDYGQEQLFSVYCRMFHPLRYEEWSGRHQWPNEHEKVPIAATSLRSLSVRFNPRRLVRRLLRLRSPTVAIIRSYFSAENFDRLLFASRGRIQFIHMPEDIPSPSPADPVLRESLSHIEEGFDRFDRFAFAALRHGMPKAFVEDFPAACARYQSFLGRHRDLRWIVCEAWIGDAGSALLLALAGEAGVRHLYNEHNYLGHPFLGNNLKYIFPLVDKFATLGWDDGRAPNLVRGASLFPWTEAGVARNPRDLLYIASIPLARAPEINAGYGESGPVNAPRYISFVCTFFDSLSEETKGEIVFRGYPSRHERVMQAYDLKYLLGERIAGMKRIDATAPSARLLMREARLVIADYVSTAYLEAMMSDIPTIFFWNPDAYLLDEPCRGIFDALQGAGICQTNPVQAARFLETVKEDPESWWRSPLVRQARNQFLSANMGEPESMIRRLLTLTKAEAVDRQ